MDHSFVFRSVKMFAGQVKIILVRTNTFLLRLHNTIMLIVKQIIWWNMWSRWLTDYNSA